MILTTKQEEGLKIAIARYKQGEKYTIISGYAGSGKSTLVKFIIEALQVDPDSVVYATYTGKAAQVLAEKGNKNVSTLHHLLYNIYFSNKTNSFVFTPKQTLDYNIVVVDEVSMAPKTLMDLLFSHNVYVICLGDPFQLPPIEKNEDNHLLDNPHIFLDEIMRQAKESEIIRLTMDIREQKRISLFNGNEVKILNNNELSVGMLMWADQVLVAKNMTRNKFNNIMRQAAQGVSSNEPPRDGDKIICLKNYWEQFSENGFELINGTTGYLSNCKNNFVVLPKYLNCLEKLYITEGSFHSEVGIFKDLSMDTIMIQTGESQLTYEQQNKLSKTKKYSLINPKLFTLGYAITYWKAQGSQWDKVLVIEEDFPFNKIDHAKALYTACTRSTKKLILLK